MFLMFTLNSKFYKYFEVKTKKNNVVFPGSIALCQLEHYVSLRRYVCGRHGRGSERFSKRALRAKPLTVPCVDSYFYRLQHDGWWWMIEGARGASTVR